jgi:hypothetical protein
MTTTPSPKTTKRKAYLLAAILTTFALILIAITTRSGATSFLSTANFTQTTVPPGILTQLASTPILATQTPPTNHFIQVTQAYLATVQAAAAFPTHTQQEIFPILSQTISSEALLAEKLKGTPSGYGILRSQDPPMVVYGPDAGVYEYNSLSWEGWNYDSFITVWTGYTDKSPSQGVVRLEFFPHYRKYQNAIVIKSPIQGGNLHIVGAAGERLIIQSEQGNTFYFDVPSLRFVDSLETSVSTATPVPTETLSALLEPADDAPDIPFYVFDTYQRENTALDFFINSSDDYDWYLFYSQMPGPITVSLIPRAGDYDLRVVRVDNGFGTIVGEDVTRGNGKKQVTISNATSGNYMVHVWSLDGSFNESLPYTLRFDAPQPEKITPILECIDENLDGTYTAHFGYDNPNPFVVVVDAEDHQNKFEPPPIFRTGQPEYFVPGRITNWFSVLFDGNGLTWLLDGQVVTANRNSLRCP